MSFSEPLIYLFGIARAGKLPVNHFGAKAVGAAEFGGVRSVNEGSLSSIVSDLRLPEGVDLNSLLDNPVQVEELVLHHHGVLKRQCMQTEVLPLRFGAIFRNETSLRETLAERQQQYLDTLADLRDSAEWGLKIYCNRALLNEYVKSETSKVAELQAELEKASKGKEFFLRRRQEKLIENETNFIIACNKKKILSQLQLFAKRHSIGKVRNSGLSEPEKSLISNDAFLVERAQKESFHQVVAKLNDEYAALGLEADITGPWPPYSFVSSTCEGGENAA